MKKSSVVILGGGIVGMSIAHQLIERGITTSITILDKEEQLGRHSSGRNSGVLHAGLYYKPGSLKAKVCVEGARRLRRWIEKRNLPINPCGKVIVPTREELDGQLDVLAERGKANGATVELWNKRQLNEFVPEARTASGRALWSPNTVVVKPLTVINQLKNELETRGVEFLCDEGDINIIPDKKQLSLSDGSLLKYGHLFNCTGLQSDRIAKVFDVGLNYTLIPFKGLYWQLRENSAIRLRTNLYPVPDLDMPFLGVHFTPSADEIPNIYIGPTATFAWGRENYWGLDAIEASSAIKNLGTLLRLYLLNQEGFQRYVHEQAFLAAPPLLIKAQKLVPSIKSNHIVLSRKVESDLNFLTLKRNVLKMTSYAFLAIIVRMS